jgi:hypothetical protein
MAVLGQYNAADKVEVIYRTASGGTGSIQADYRRARDAYYSVSGCGQGISRGVRGTGPCIEASVKRQVRG